MRTGRPKKLMEITDEDRDKLQTCGFRAKWGTDSDGKWGGIPIEVGRGSDGKWGTF